MCKEEGRISRLNPVRISLKLEVPVTEKVRVNTSCIEQGTAVTKGEWQERKLSERDKGLKWYDFTIDSLQVSGLISEMKYMQLNEGSMAAADALDGVDVPQFEVDNNVENNVE